MKKTLSLDLRERIVAAYDAREGTRAEVAKRFKVSVGMVKKLLAQRARHRFSGRKPRLMPEHGAQLKQLIAQEPDLTLAELKARLGLDYTVAAIHWVVNRLGLTYKKRRSMRPNRTGRTWRGPAAAGSGGKAGSTRRSSSSSTNHRPKPT